MGLREYRRKRDFSRTAEPRGGRGAKHKAPIFVVQKHDASHLHYDFRLELDGVLKSWAVPKGPDTDPAVKRLAMHVEDHPLEYGNFEGIIPEGEYGGGTVMLWDRGTWEPVEDDARKAYREGRLKFILHGEKLQGAWMLVRRGGRPSGADERTWFLFKERDKFAGGKTPITDREPLSVKTNRTLEEIASDADRVWGPGGEKRSTKKSAVERRNTSVQRPTATTARAQIPRRSNSRLRKSEDATTTGDVVAGVKLSHPDKVFYPEQSYTKRDLADYYEQIADWMLPHVFGRPLALLRCPAGCEKPCFFQKHPGTGAPKHLPQVDVSESSRPEYNLVIKDTAGLIELVQLNVLETHIWGSTAKKLERPDRLIFDLDPDPKVEWPDVIDAARAVRLVLEELGLQTFLKTTGGKGLHIVVPIAARTDWDDAKAFSKAVADFIVRAAPDRFIATMSKSARRGKVFIDYLRNGRGATAVAAYSTRARPGAPVSMPIAWDELSPQLRSDQFTIENARARLAKLKRDPWEEMPKVRQSITKTMLTRLVE
ncbi:MAG TPA: non-homologous end-joining DNA ligase [Pirellulales bacterium]|nr:non-homologous end-joining DNA ligase [Pirellulales bacterium]